MQIKIKIKKLLSCFVVTISLVISGCGEPSIDTTSELELGKSISAITKDLPNQAKLKFERNVQRLQANDFKINNWNFAEVTTVGDRIGELISDISSCDKIEKNIVPIKYSLDNISINVNSAMMVGNRLHFEIITNNNTNKDIEFIIGNVLIIVDDKEPITVEQLIHNVTKKEFNTVIIESREEIKTALKGNYSLQYEIDTIAHHYSETGYLNDTPSKDTLVEYTIDLNECRSEISTEIEKISDEVNGINLKK